MSRESAENDEVQGCRTSTGADEEREDELQMIYLTNEALISDLGQRRRMVSNREMKTKQT